MHTVDFSAVIEEVSTYLVGEQSKSHAFKVCATVESILSGKRADYIAYHYGNKHRVAIKTVVSYFRHLIRKHEVAQWPSLEIEIL